MYKIHGNYERVFKELALAENPPLRTALQKAALEIEILGKSIDVLIDEEDLIAEQIKEYLYFTDALKVTRRSCVIVALQPLRWCCVDCVIHHERDVREE